MALFKEVGNFSLEGVLMAVLCIYVLFGKLLGMYVFDRTGSTGMRRRLMVQVLVLGDIGRSPRMRYHAASLADAGCNVDLIGYTETNPGARINVHRHIRVRSIRKPWSVPEGSPRLFYLVWAPFKALFMAVQLFWIMGCISQSPDFIIVQNPPSIPTLFIGQLISTLRKAWLIIDWHNFGYSILAMKFGYHHKVVQWAKWYEQKFGKTAFAHLTVTDAMHEEIKNVWENEGIILTLRDMPQSDFRRLTLDHIHRQFNHSLRVIENLVKETPNGTEFLGKYRDEKYGTLLTDGDEDGLLIWREERPKLIVSSTSWTEDEDFSILLSAIEQYESTAKPSDPRLLFVITGNGPLRKHYEEKIRKMVLNKTRIVTAWLEAVDYPVLLGSADLGVSLHVSSSGLDLPMKIADMFGSGLPVCAIQFPCLKELVHDGENGLVFENSQDLSEQFMVKIAWMICVSPIFIFFFSAIRNCSLKIPKN
ncbi:hypothetical protein BDB01DRAFT_772606 [Pilobolus umbonatus]|nr:hypothetical protein BDB01DRAFT_772606 [Pilobolus umbonatus]